MPTSFAQLFRFADLKPAPWKNGGGITREILLHPPAASFAKEDFTWRLSTAEIQQPGPFSLFPDFERLITLVDGNALHLELADGPKTLLPGQVLHFSGGEKVDCSLPSGPVSDLGLLFDPDMVNASISSVHLEGRPRSFVLGEPTVIFHLVKGEATASVYPGELEFRLQKGDSLLLTPYEMERLVLWEAGASADLLAVELEEKVLSSS